MFDRYPWLIRVVGVAALVASPIALPLYLIVVHFDSVKEYYSDCIKAIKNDI